MDAFGIYIHWPYCASKCPYCDFNSHGGQRAIGEDQYLAAALTEMAHYAQMTPGRTVSSVFFGGGTPSLMSPATVGRLLDAIAEHWSVARDAEITIEANPSSVETARFAGYRTAGVNRVSLGVQSLRDDQLRALGRIHTADEARAALKVAKRHFERVTFDMIYARNYFAQVDSAHAKFASRTGSTRADLRPDAQSGLQILAGSEGKDFAKLSEASTSQSLANWRAELTEALALAAGHISLYQLTIEPGTPFHAQASVGKLRLPSAEEAAAFYTATQELCETAGLPAYEISNHARPGDESRHNLLYWRYGEYIGVGPGAHGRIVADGVRLALEGARDPAEWAALVESAGHGGVVREALTPLEEAQEMLLMGLRLHEGLSLDALAERTGHRIEEETLASLATEGLIARQENGNRIAATPNGRLLLNAIIEALANALEPVKQ
jgi:oxygen-independent coproporphyrinogen-3 oxidase